MLDHNAYFANHFILSSRIFLFRIFFIHQHQGGVLIKKSRSKFNVSNTKTGKQRRTYNGITFDSQKEMEYYRDVVCVGLKDGTITDCKLQVKYELQPKYTYNGKTILPINYVADFVITYSDNSVIIWLSLIHI